jgi:hypothetical protein
MSKSSIQFPNEVALARFLSEFIPNSTAVFNVEDGGAGTYILTFTGGY